MYVSWLGALSLCIDYTGYLARASRYSYLIHTAWLRLQLPSALRSEPLEQVGSDSRRSRWTPATRCPVQIKSATSSQGPRGNGKQSLAPSGARCQRILHLKLITRNPTRQPQLGLSDTACSYGKFTQFGRVILNPLDLKSSKVLGSSVLLR